MSPANVGPRQELCPRIPACLLCVFSQAADACKGTSSQQRSLGRAYHLFMRTFTVLEYVAASEGNFFFFFKKFLPPGRKKVGVFQPTQANTHSSVFLGTDDRHFGEGITIPPTELFRELPPPPQHCISRAAESPIIALGISTGATLDLWDLRFMASRVDSSLLSSVPFLDTSYCSKLVFPLIWVVVTVPSFRPPKAPGHRKVAILMTAFTRHWSPGPPCLHLGEPHRKGFPPNPTPATPVTWLQGTRSLSVIEMTQVSQKAKAGVSSLKTTF